MPNTDLSEIGRLRKHVWGAVGFQVVALAIAGWINRHALNPDGVAYLRIASYYAEGRLDLAISDYWSPLISWLLVPSLKLGVPPLFAARMGMGLSAIFFLFGCLRIFRAFRLSSAMLAWGAWTCAIVSVPWSVENITPDLLMAGLVCFALASMVEERWLGKAFVPFACGLVWGLAYFGKAVALPMAVLTTAVLAVLWWKKRPASSRLILRSLILTLLGIALISAPWVWIISARSGAITISNAARLNHVLVGPTVGKLVYLLDQGFQKPEPGRITIWEEPPMPYPDWSPFASSSNAWLQARIVAKNIPVVSVMLTSVNLAFPLLVVYALWQLRRRQPSSDALAHPAWAAVPIAALSVLFLPNYVLITEQRYLYATFPLFFVLGAGIWSREESPLPRWILRFGPAFLSLALLLPTFARIGLRPAPSRMAGDCAAALAEKIRPTDLSGPVAGSGRLSGGRAGLYLAYLLNKPWYGDELSAGALNYRRSDARLIVVNRGSRAASELEQDPWFHNLDAHLFDSATKVAEFPLQVFERNGSEAK